VASRGFTLCFTGLPSAVKKTIAEMTANELNRRGYKVQTFDDETSGARLKSSLDHPKNNEEADIQRIERVCDLGMGNDAIVIVAVNPQSSGTLEDLRQILQPLVEIEIRGSSHRSRDDESGNAGDVDSVHEQLISSKVVVEGDTDKLEQSVAHILSRLEDLELIARLTPKDSSYDEEDEQVIKSRLESLGYL